MQKITQKWELRPFGTQFPFDFLIFCYLSMMNVA